MDAPLCWAIASEDVNVDFSPLRAFAMLFFRLPDKLLLIDPEVGLRRLDAVVCVERDRRLKRVPFRRSDNAETTCPFGSMIISPRSFTMHHPHATDLTTADSTPPSGLLGPSDLGRKAMMSESPANLITSP